MQRRQFLKFIGKAVIVAPALLLVAPVATISAQPEVFVPDPASIMLAQGQQAAQFFKEGIISEKEFRQLAGLPARTAFDLGPVNTVPSLDFTLTSITPRWYVEFPNKPTKDDPFGNWGYVAVKYQIEDKSYGDWVKISDIDSTYNYTNLIHAAQYELDRHSREKIAKINPTYILAPIQYWAEGDPTWLQ